MTTRGRSHIYLLSLLKIESAFIANLELLKAEKQAI